MSGPGGGADQLPGSDQLPEATEGTVFDIAADVKDVCEENKSQLESLKEIMLRNKQTLKKKEEEVQEYARKLSKIKSRTKLSRRSKDTPLSVESTSEVAVKVSNPVVENFDDTIDDISQAKTPKAKSSLLQKKLAENRKIFEQRSREMTENKRAVEEKVEAIRQQLNESDTTILELQKELSTVQPVQPIVVTTQVIGPVLQHHTLKDKDNRIAELSNKVLQLEATILDLQENLKEKDSVIDSKTKAITLMSADLSKKSKSTLDTLEDTKDEMRIMQANFVLIETSLKQKIDSLLQQLQGRDGQIAEYEDTVEGLKEDLEKRKRTDIATANFSRSTLDTLAETKDAMKSMQENFILIETSLKSKITNLLDQLQEREIKLTEAEERIFKLESDTSMVISSDLKELQLKLEVIEQHNRQLQNEKYELQKSIAELKDTVVSNEPGVSNGLIVEKDNRIAELENLIEELRKSNQLLLEESKTELQSQIIELSSKNEEYSNKINNLEKLVHHLESEKNELVRRIPENRDESKEDAKLTKELDDLNKRMIKLKAQHKGKVRSLQKQLESFKKISNANAELVKLGNQVTLLEEEKGNLQLSLVDFDELKASAGDWQERITDLETKISAQSNEIDSQVQAIATLENQKLDLMQELHMVKQEVSALEAENAESENLRVTAEMKIVELEEQLDALNKSMAEPKQSDSTIESQQKHYLDKIESLSQENNDLIIKLTRLEEKGTSDAGSTESFETFHETDRNELLKKIDLLTQENNNLIIKLTKLEEKTGSTDSFETPNDIIRNKLLKKIELLTQENNNLIVKLAKFEEKSSSDSGSSESFDRIPEHVENLSRLDVLTQENNELVIKLIKLEEKLAKIEDSPNCGSKSEEIEKGGVAFTLENKIHVLTQENNDLVIQLTKLQEKLGAQFLETPLQSVDSTDTEVQEMVKVLTDANDALVIKTTEVGEENGNLKANLDLVIKERNELKHMVERITTNAFLKKLIEKLNESDERNQTSAQGTREEIIKLMSELTEETIELDDSVGYQGSDTVTLIENEIEDCQIFISKQKEIIDDMKLKLSNKQEELDLQAKKISEYQATLENLDKLQMELKESLSVIEEWKLKYNEMERKINILASEKAMIEENLRIVETENANLMKQSEAKDLEAVKLKIELDDTISLFESKLEEEIKLVSVKENEITALKEIIANKDADLHDKYEQLQNEMITIDNLQDDLNNYKTQFEDQINTIKLLKEEIEKLNATLETGNEKINNARVEIDRLHAELGNSKSLIEFDHLLKTLSKNEEIMAQMQNKIDEQANENLVTLSQIENINLNAEKQLIEKQEEIVRLMEINSRLHEELSQAKSIKSLTTNQISDLQSSLEQSNIYIEELREELSGAYKKLELVKAQHMEDTEMQSRRLEDLIEELNNKVQENEGMKSEIEEKHKFLVQNVTVEAKLALESTVKNLEEKLLDSETKAKLQLDKMKKIAANLKKKSVQCQELEAKVSDLEEKWNSEKLEKELMNKSIQESDFIIREKDKKILELEKRAMDSDNQASIALEKVERLMQEINISREKVSLLSEQITEMSEEIEKLRVDINAKESEFENERANKEKLLLEYKTYKLQMETDYQKQQYNLEDATECARELRVRMEVMESEYVEQLSLIQKLKAENGMLSSKETQINEKLENVEKESEERKCLLEKLQKEKVEACKVQTLEYELRENNTKTSEEQCQISFQALQAKLQERDAVVESLEIELGKSNDRVNKLEEALVAVEERRYFLEGRAEVLGAELEQSFQITAEASFSEDMLEQRLAILMAKDEAITEKLNETIDENNELTEKIQSLQDLNTSLQERIDAVEEELKYGRETNEKLQNVDILYSELLQKHNLQETELKKIQQELYSAKQHIDTSEREVTSQINQLDAERKQLLEKCEKLEDIRSTLVQEIDSLKDDIGLCQPKIFDLEAEVEMYKKVNSQLQTELNNQKKSIPMPSNHSEDVERLKSLLAEKEVEIENYQKRNMQLQMAAFDAPKSVDVSTLFDTSIDSDTSTPGDEIFKLTNLLTKKEREYTSVCSELDNLKQRLGQSESEYMKLLNERDHYCSQLVTELQNLQTEYSLRQNELVKLNEILSEKNEQINLLNAQLVDITSKLEMYSNRQHTYDEEICRLSGMITSKDKEIQKIKEELDSTNEMFKTITSSAKENYNLVDDKKTLIDQNKNVKSVYESQLDDLKFQQQEVEELVNQIISVAEQKVNKFYKIRDKRSTGGATGLREVAFTFNELLDDFETMKREKEELYRSQELYKIEIAELKNELASYTVDTNSKPVQKLENQITEIPHEKSSPPDSSEKQESVMKETNEGLDDVLGQKKSFEIQASNLATALNQLQTQQVQATIDNSENPTLELKPAKETFEKILQPEELNFECVLGLTGKSDIGEEGWGWNPEDVLLEEEHQSSRAPSTPNVEISLQVKIAELEDQIKDLETKNNICDIECKAAQLKNVKLVKKLKEFKVRNEVLQQNIKQQKLISCFSDLDSAIEEELKSQIEKLESSLKDAMEEQKKITGEKEYFQKRLEVLTAANERFVEMKERQDMDMEVWRIRNKELVNKIQSLEWQLQEISSNTNQEGYNMPNDSLSKLHHQEIQKWSDKLYRATIEISQLEETVENKNIELEKLNKVLHEKEGITDQIRQQLAEKQIKLDNCDCLTSNSQQQDMVALADRFPGFKMTGVDDFQLQIDVNNLKSELIKKQEEIEHFKYMLSQNTYPELLQKLQDDVNQLHSDKYHTEQSLESKIKLLNAELESKQMEIENFKRMRHEFVPTEQTMLLNQEEIVRLNNELHTKEQEINELRYMITQKDLPISHQVNFNQQFDEYDTQETIQKLNGDLYTKQEEIESLRTTLAMHEKNIEDFKLLKRSSEEDKILISKLTSEKELIKEESEKLLQSKLAEKEVEIESLKQRLAEKNQELLDTLQLRDIDVKNLRLQMERLNFDHTENLRHRDEELSLIKSDLADKERRLAEVSITKDAEIHNLRVQIHDKDVRIEELVTLSEEEERQLSELRQVVEYKEKEINSFKALLAEKVQEYEIMKKPLKKDTSTESADLASAEGETGQTVAVESSSNNDENLIPRSGIVSVEGELDLALYMLHQRDVRCEELTLELMQLLEERDTLQLRLSNAIRVNEELRKQKSVTSSSKIEALPSTSLGEPLVEHPSPSKNDGPVEIARDALDVTTFPISEDKHALAEKLSQLHTVHQRRDVTLCDERESRHTQQMSFVARRDMLSSLPPEAAAKLVNANYTLSRDVQSQSSVLMNWLWGKSTPKVMHM